MTVILNLKLISHAAGIFREVSWMIKNNTCDDDKWYNNISVNTYI